MKIEFFDDKSEKNGEHEASQEEIENLFEIAEKLTENDLEKLARACKAINNTKIS